MRWNSSVRCVSNWLIQRFSAIENTSNYMRRVMPLLSTSKDSGAYGTLVTASESIQRLFRVTSALDEITES